MKLRSKAKAIQERNKGKTLKNFSVLISPIVTESGIRQSGSSGKQSICFKVASGSKKPEIKAAVEGIFNVKVDRVNTVNLMGKTKRTARGVGRRSAIRKAYVTLAEGHKLSVVEGV